MTGNNLPVNFLMLFIRDNKFILHETINLILSGSALLPEPWYYVSFYAENDISNYSYLKIDNIKFNSKNFIAGGDPFSGVNTRVYLNSFCELLFENMVFGLFFRRSEVPGFPSMLLRNSLLNSAGQHFDLRYLPLNRDSELKNLNTLVELNYVDTLTIALTSEFAHDINIWNDIFGILIYNFTLPLYGFECGLDLWRDPALIGVLGNLIIEGEIW